jgi:hypothetical protein
MNRTGRRSTVRDICPFTSLAETATEPGRTGPGGAHPSSPWRPCRARRVLLRGRLPGHRRVRSRSAMRTGAAHRPCLPRRRRRRLWCSWSASAWPSPYPGGVRRCGGGRLRSTRRPRGGDWWRQALGDCERAMWASQVRSAEVTVKMSVLHGRGNRGARSPPGVPLGRESQG